MELYLLLGIIFVLLSQTVIILYLFRLKKAILYIKKNLKDEHHDDNHSPTDTTSWQEEVQRTVELQCMQVRNAVQKQTHQLHKKEIELSPKRLSVTNDELFVVYNENQIQAIDAFWREYQSYLQKYWLTKDENVRTVFRGSEDDPQSESAKVIYASKQLTKRLNDHLQHIFDN
ncbi:hypothetical protein LGQ02_08205 [Bacillus shivajii]|uniref:hypothetical protein n=1 Tax=Bacillus shivajii TaxID=1983719 RepID=UPI001CFB3633|nr:hypothetical protein [Bacillus shivajii]UCZ54714.1 hypothetical protein LGQ02_08205 [Bacillus shivajii]